MAAADYVTEPILKFFLHRGGRPHMAMRYRCAAALPPFGAAAELGHFDGCSVLVDEHQL